MFITRVWAMSNSKTFKIKPIKELIIRYCNKGIVIDPYANEGSIKEFLNDATYVSNDINTNFLCDYHLDAKEFIKQFDDASVDCALFDPPYSPRQVKECYNLLNKTVTITDTQASYWSKAKTLLSQKIKPGGIVISFGWNSNGIGKNRGFKIIEILLVAHGANKNDTIVVVERKGDA